MARHTYLALRSRDSNAGRFRCASGRSTRPAAGPKHAGTPRQPPLEGRQSSPEHADVPPVCCTLCPLRQPRGGRTLDCRTVGGPSLANSSAPSSGGNARLDLRLLRPTVVRALARSRDLPSPRAQEYQSEPIPAPPRRSDLYSSASPSRPSAATDGYHPSAQDQKHGLSSLPGGSKSVLNAPRQRLTRQADGEPT
jgi:hypothetical protein